MDDKFPPRTVFWPSMHDRPFFDGIKEMMIQREPDAEIGSLYISIPNPDYKPAKYKEYEKQLEHYRRYENTNHPVKKPIEPQPPFEPMSDVEFKTLLIEHGVTKNPVTSYNFVDNKTNGDNDGVTAKNKTVSNNLTSSSLLGASATHASTNNNQKPTPIMIYAKKCYGIEYADFTDEKYTKEAKIDLGIDDESKLIPIDERKNNFKLFKQNNFVDFDFDEKMPSYISGDKPTVNMKAYNEIEKYALSDYGSLMIRRVLKEPKKPIFLMGVSDAVGTRAHGKFANNFIILPVNFPSVKYFSVSKQKILGVAIIHHEFEHTKHGQYALPKSIEEELKAVRFKENPVRIINGLEPRYVYYDYNTEQSVNILTKDVKKGKWTFDKKDPRIMVKIK